MIHAVAMSLAIGPKATSIGERFARRYHVDFTKGVAKGNEEESIFAVMSGTRARAARSQPSLLAPHRIASQPPFFPVSM